MIRVRVYEDALGHIERYEVEGHAESVEEGFDPVCALVSLATQTPLIALKRCLKRNVDCVVDQEAGSLAVELGGASDEQTELLLRTMVEVLKDLHKAYPDFVVTERLRR